LKPANNGFDKQGTVKLFDFGFAREYKESGELRKQQRRMSGGTGTPRYMAPEVARMEEDFGFLGNLYSFAIVLWQILTTRVPFSEFKTPTEFYAKVVLGEQRASLKYPKNKINHWKCPKSIREYHQVNVMRSLGPVMKCRRGKGINPNSLH
jgi:serine/threonine protein kinase